MSEKNIPQRFARLALLLGKEGLARLAEARVFVLGLGGVGSSCAEALARGGVGTLLLLDGDTVEESNINRQALAFVSTVGKSKVEVMQAMIADIDPDCRVETRDVFLTPDNLNEVLSSFPRPDYVVDCIDTVSQKLGIAAWCAQEKIPLLSAMGAANKLDPSYLRFSTVEKTSQCPLSKVMRRECRRRGIKKLEVLYSEEPPLILERKVSTKKADTLGSMSYMPPVMGQMLAGKVIRRLAGFEPFQVTPVRQRPFLLDTHAHPDFLTPDTRKVLLEGLHRERMAVVAQTVLPSTYDVLQSEYGADGADDKSRPLLSLGFHPWYIRSPQQAESECAHFDRAAETTRFYGEIGLDYSPRPLEQAEAGLQESVFCHILNRIKERMEEEPTLQPVVSIHAVRAESRVLDLWEKILGGTCAVPILHRFRGTSDTLSRLMRLGGFLSVHPEMLTTKRGRAYVKQIPAERLLLETDLPSQQEGEGTEPFVAEALLSTWKEALSQSYAALCAMRREPMASILTETQKRLYGVPALKEE